ncbi:unnamed protein product [Peniophora sp. CBMAI 1063]|nr:unnamed protein product [Peniophora sp. CBMAI 1063]
MAPENGSARGIVLPRSLLDTDLYKLTMQQAVMKHYPNVQCSYRFTHRDRVKGRHFTRAVFDAFQESVNHFGDLALTPEERTWLAATCPYFTPDYLDYLSTYRFKPEQVKLTFVPLTPTGKEGDIEMEAVGLWSEAIFWEVPLMATLSEIYFKLEETDWNEDGQEEQAAEKTKKLLDAGCLISEFGTRRRRSFYIQDLVVQQMARVQAENTGKGKFLGTSNVYLAMKHSTTPVGTIAHEWFMGVAALTGYDNVNGRAMNLWEQVYGKSLLIALTDTFSTKAFFKDFIQDQERAKRWTGLRQDSGDPFAFAPLAKAAYDSLGIDVHEKLIIYSDSLTVDKALKLKEQCSSIGFIASFGIGTHLTNDYVKASDPTEKSKALNMVIKLASVNGKPCVKISDDLLKNTGDMETVNMVKDMHGLPKA